MWHDQGVWEVTIDPYGKDSECGKRVSLRQAHEILLYGPHDKRLLADQLHILSRMLNPVTRTIAYGSGIPESTVRLLVTLGLAYPIAPYYQRNLLKSLSATGVEERNSYILTTGLGLAIFFSGFEIFHSIITIYASYIFIWFAGYWGKSGEDYQISWTTPQCVLCLRLMGLGMDIFDGKSNAVEPTKMPQAHSVDDDIKIPLAPLSFGSDTALESIPELRYIRAYCYFPSAFLIGPQFSISLYKKFITFDNFANLAPNICGKMVYNKYLGVWNLTEGACTCFGISYAGSSNGQADFSGLANVSHGVFEFAISTEQVIASFNMNTNLWVKVYVFKRLKFLNNKSLSQVVSLAFLAIWHGFHKTFTAKYLRHTQNDPILDTAWKVLAWITCTSTVNYAVAGFDLLLFRKAWIAYSTIGFIGHISIASVLFRGKFLKSPQITQSAKKTE